MNENDVAEMYWQVLIAIMVIGIMVVVAVL